MRYVDAGYVIALSALALYGLALVVRRRRLERAARVVDFARDGGPGGSGPVPRPEARPAGGRPAGGSAAGGSAAGGSAAASTAAYPSPVLPPDQPVTS